MNKINSLRQLSTSINKTFYLETFGKLLQYKWSNIIIIIILFKFFKIFLYALTNLLFNIKITQLGCQMNISDSDIVTKVLTDAGFRKIESLEEADVVLTNTCAVRENAESKVWQRLKVFNSIKEKRSISSKRKSPLTVGVLGCMAERISSKM